MSYGVSMSQVGLYGAAGLVFYWLVASIYNVFFHPLRSYPGPLLGKLTDAYGGWHSMRLRLPQVTYRDIKEYGMRTNFPNPSATAYFKVRSFVMARIDWSSVRPKLYKVCLNHCVTQATKLTVSFDIYNNERVTKSDVYLVTLATTGKICIFNALDRNVHRVRRRLVGSAVTERAIRGFEPTMQDQIHIFLKVVLAETQKGESIDVSQRVRRLGSDIVGFLAFGFPFNSQTEEQYRFLPEAVTFGNGMSNVKMQFPFLSNSVFSTLTDLLTHFELRKFYKMLDLMISNRLAKPKDEYSDLYKHVVDQLEETKDVRMSDVWAEAMFFFPAGGDTTATAMSSVFFYLSRYPECYKKLAQEIRSTFTSADEIRGGPKLSGSRYLRACIDEALRMSPPVSGTLWRQLAADADPSQPLVIDGHVVPPGTHVGVNFYTIHHDESHFPDSHNYKPERWLDADEATLSHMNKAFAAFSIGPRGCAGKPMAYLEASLVIAKMLWYFDFEIAAGDSGKAGEGTPGAPFGRHRPKEFQLWDIFSSTQEGPRLKFTPRENYFKELL